MSEPPAPVLLIVPEDGATLPAAALERTAEALAADAEIQILAAVPADAPLPDRVARLEGGPPPATIALARAGDRPNPAALRAAALELASTEGADALLGAVTHGEQGRLRPPPPQPVGPEVLLADARIAPASVIVGANGEPAARLEQALAAFSRGAVAEGMLELLGSATVIARDHVLAHVVEDPAAGWWSDERGLAELGELARSELAAGHGLAGALRRRALHLAFNERPVLGRPWVVPDLVGEGADPETLRDFVGDLIWALERQADSLIVLEGSWEERPVPPSPETGEVIDTELFERDSEIRMLRRTEAVLREQLADLHERLRECGRARKRDAEAMRRLRAGAAAPAQPPKPPGPVELRAGRDREGSRSAFVRAWRRLVPARARTAVWRLAPGRSEALRRRLVGRARRAEGSDR